MNRIIKTGVMFVALWSGVFAEPAPFTRTRLEKRVLLGVENIVVAEIAGPMKRMLEVEDGVLAYEEDATKGENFRYVWKAYQGSFSKVYYNSRVNDYQLEPDQRDFRIFIRLVQSPGKDIRLGDKMTGGGFVVLEYDRNLKGFRVLSRPGPEREARMKDIIQERLEVEKQLLESFYAE